MNCILSNWKVSAQQKKALSRMQRSKGDKMIPLDKGLILKYATQYQENNLI